MRKYHYIDYVSFGRKIAKKRLELKLSQKTLADKLDCNASYLSKVENGKAKPSLDFVVLLANLLDVGLDYFFPHTNAGSKLEKYELQSKWNNCSPELIKFLNCILNEVKQLEIDIVNRDKIY